MFLPAQNRFWQLAVGKNKLVMRKIVATKQNFIHLQNPRLYLNTFHG